METQLISSSNESESKSKWRDLPEDIVLQIARRVSYTADLPRLRGVCPEWRSIIPRRRFLPSLSSRSIKLPPLSLGDNQDDLKVPLALVQSRFYLLSPLQGQGVDSTATTASSSASTSTSSGLGGRWLARMGETGRANDEQWRLMNPFNIEDYLYIQPPISGRPLNLLDCHALELAAPLSLVRAGDDTIDSISDRVVGGWDFDSGHLSSVLVQLERCGRGGRLVSWKLGDAEWTSHDDLTDEGFVDIAFHDGKFYAFELSRWRVLVMDASSPCDSREFIPGPDPERLEAEASGGGCYWLTFQERLLSVVGGCHFVAAANSRLYLVITTNPPHWSETRTPTSFVFVLKQQQGGDLEEEEEDGKDGSWWKQVGMDSLGDQILFIGPDVAFSLPAASVNLPQWKPNSICIFSGVLPHMYHQHKKDIGMQTECHEMITWAKLCFRVFLADKTGVVSFQELPNEIYTALFFPPPPWLHWRCPTLQNLLIKLANDNLLCDSIEYRDLHRGLLPHLY